MTFLSIHRPTSRSLNILLLYIFSTIHISVCQLAGPCQRPVLGRYLKVPTTGQINASIIFIDFPDAPLNGSARDLLPILPFTGTNEFLRQSSFQQFNLNFTSYTDRIYHMPSVSTSYRYAIPLTTEALGIYASDALAAVGTNISFAETQLLFIVPPQSASIPFSTTSSFPVVTSSGRTIPGFISLGLDAFSNTTRFDYTLASLIAYNLGLRQMCPPATGQGAGDVNLGGFSPFCIESPLAPDFLARQKWTLGWLDGETQVACVDSGGNRSTKVDHKLTLAAVEIAGDNSSTSRTKLAVMALPGGLSLYAEARTQKGLDRNACLSGFGAGGVLLYYALATSDPALIDPVYIINPLLYSDTVIQPCANRLPGFLAPLGLASNQASNYTVPGTGVRVTVLSQNVEEGTFDVRFESGLQDGSSMTTSSSSMLSTATSTTTAKSEATRSPGTFNILTFAMVPGAVHIAISLW